jgi:hypothetical protein
VKNDVLPEPNDTSQFVSVKLDRNLAHVEDNLVFLRRIVIDRPGVPRSRCYFCAIRLMRYVHFWFDARDDHHLRTSISSNN